jgi:ribosomal protein S18 acetylase RimI-like enzyme
MSDVVESIACPAPYRLRFATPDDVPAYRAHLLDMLPENGFEGRWAAPFTHADQRARFTPEREAENRAAVERSIGDAAWSRIILCDDTSTGKLVGHADVHGGNIPSEMHRCRLGIGLLIAHHRRGLGEALLRAALAWAKASGLVWMDLGVFDDNAPAVALYRKLGFVETGRVPDRFRVGTVALTDVVMSRDLRTL